MKIKYFHAYAKTYIEDEYIEKFVIGFEDGGADVCASEIKIVSLSMEGKEARFDPVLGRNVVDVIAGGKVTDIEVEDVITESNELTILCGKIPTREDFEIKFKDLKLTKSDLNHTYNEETDRFTRHSYEGHGVKFNYRLYTPKVEAGKKYPIVITLHGSGETADKSNYDNNLHIAVSRLALAFATDDWQETHPCYVVAPQFPSLEQSYETDAYHDAYKDIIQSVAQEGYVDVDRIYAATLSMGSRIMYSMLRHYPDYFAGLIINSGNPDGVKMECVKELPITFGHIENDMVIMTQFAKDAFRDSILCENYAVKMDLYPYEDVERYHLQNSHQGWAMAMDNLENLEWLFSQKKGVKCSKTGMPMVKTPEAEQEGKVIDGWVYVPLERLAESYNWILEEENGIITVKSNDRTVTIDIGEKIAESPDITPVSKVNVKLEQDDQNMFVGYDFVSGCMGLHTTVYFI